MRFLEGEQFLIQILKKPVISKGKYSNTRDTREICGHTRKGQAAYHKNHYSSDFPVLIDLKAGSLAFISWKVGRGQSIYLTV